MNTTDYRLKGAIVYDLMINKMKKSFRSNKAILDIGCGNMRLLENIPGKPKQGIDIDENHIKESKEKYSGATYRIASALDIPFKDSTFDNALCINVFHHVSLKKCLPEIKRVLKKDADFVAVVMNKHYPITVDHMLFINMLKKRKDRFSWQSGDYTPVMYTPDELRKTFKTEGFQIIELKAFDSYLMNLFDLGGTIILRLVPPSFRNMLFPLFTRINTVIYFIETEVFGVTKSRSFYVHVRKK